MRRSFSAHWGCAAVGGISPRQLSSLCAELAAALAPWAGPLKSATALKLTAEDTGTASQQLAMHLAKPPLEHVKE